MQLCRRQQVQRIGNKVQDFADEIKGKSTGKKLLQKVDATKRSLKTLHNHDHSSTAIKSLCHTCQTAASSSRSGKSRRCTARRCRRSAGKTPRSRRAARVAAYATRTERVPTDPPSESRSADTSYCSCRAVSTKTKLSTSSVIAFAPTAVGGD